MSRPDVLVIGSGFGGTFAAREAARAGKRVVILERGAWWRHQPLPELPETTPLAWQNQGRTLLPQLGLRIPSKASWRTPPGSRLLPGSAPQSWRPRRPGLLERIRWTGDGTRMDVFSGACVGGGSVVYGAMMLRPRAAWLDSVLPEGLVGTDLDKDFDAVQSAIGFRSPTDEELAELFRSRRRRGSKRRSLYSGQRFAREVLSKRADGVWEPLAAAIDWPAVVAGLKASERPGVRPPDAARGQYVLGTNDGTKLSLDRDVLPDLLRTPGVTLHPLHEATSLQRAGEHWEVEAFRVDEHGERTERHTYEARHVILAAGPMHTTRLLLAAQARGQVESNAEIGLQWGGNGDLLVTQHHVGLGLATTGGPCIGGIVARTEDPDEVPPWRLVFTPGPDQLPDRLFQLGMTPSTPAGWLEWGNGHAVLRWDDDRARVDVDALRAVMRPLGGAIDVLADERGDAALTYHPLGGCVLGRATDLRGEVRGAPGLFVADGSLLPGHTVTCNPAWTIAALARYVARQQFGTAA